MDGVPGLCWHWVGMHRLSHDIAIWIALCAGVLAAMVAPLLPHFAGKSGGRATYLKRVARKYCVSPLKLR